MNSAERRPTTGGCAQSNDIARGYSTYNCGLCFRSARANVANLLHAVKSSRVRAHFNGAFTMITPTYLRERAAYYRELAETEEMRAHREDLRALARAFDRDAEKLERQSQTSDQKTSS